MLFEGCPDDDMDLVWRGRVELMAVDGVLPDTSVKLKTEKSNNVCIVPLKCVKLVDIYDFYGQNFTQRTLKTCKLVVTQ